MGKQNWCSKPPTRYGIPLHHGFYGCVSTGEGINRSILMDWLKRGGHLNRKLYHAFYHQISTGGVLHFFCIIQFYKSNLKIHVKCDMIHPRYAKKPYIWIDVLNVIKCDQMWCVIHPKIGLWWFTNLANLVDWACLNMFKPSQTV